jgi:phytoene synthase
MPPPLSPLGDLARRHDPDRFLCALFAPAERRELLFLLAAFNHELARAREVASEPMLALIRLQWWREVVEGARRRHPVAEPLRVVLDEGRLAAGDLLAMIDAREMEVEEQIPDLRAFEAYVGGIAGALAVAAGRVLGGDAATLGRLRRLGAAYGVASVLRSQATLARRGRCLLPVDLLAENGSGFHEALERPDGAPVRAARRRLGSMARSWLDEARGDFPAGIVAAALTGVLARRDLRRESVAVQRGLGDRLAVTWAAWRRRV